VQAGRVRALGVTTRKRATLLPDVPAIAEAVRGYENFGRYSLVAPPERNKIFWPKQTPKWSRR
jgi:tripartite-type tricarboxylate transporter receptor subunit TctC